MIENSTERTHNVRYVLFYILTLTVLLIMSATPPPSTPIESILTIVIALIAAISGWIAFFYQYYSERPKIRGKILQVMVGRLQKPKLDIGELTVFTLFLYLTNLRKSAIHIRDFILEVDLGNGFEKLKILRGITDTTFHFGYRNGGEVQIPDFKKGLIHPLSKPVEYGTPLYGYLLFGGDLKYYDADIHRFRITCIDVFDHKHEITTVPAKFVPLSYLQDVFKIKIPVQ